MRDDVTLWSKFESYGKKVYSILLILFHIQDVSARTYGGKVTFYGLGGSSDLSDPLATGQNAEHSLQWDIMFSSCPPRCLSVLTFLSCQHRLIRRALAVRHAGRRPVTLAVGQQTVCAASPFLCQYGRVHSRPNWNSPESGQVHYTYVAAGLLTL